ncbi:unnamed protein product [Polarella glacialis]|uniref:Uncharacterized protein n=2 Tax=Polarella glacialis TaxID=89957 RepID=A0A813DXC9_POLGL|nr:unnamed protein product [Polarella glacialis]
MDLQERASLRPLLVEDYARPEHVRTAPNARLIPNYTQPTPLEAKIARAMSQPEFHDSQWGKEVKAIRERQDSRTPLSEIQYPPKVYPRPVFKKVVSPIDERMHAVTSQAWFQKSDWAGHVRELKVRMDDRLPLSETPCVVGEKSKK